MKPLSYLIILSRPNNVKNCQTKDLDLEVKANPQDSSWNINKVTILRSDMKLQVKNTLTLEQIKGQTKCHNTGRCIRLQKYSEFKLSDFTDDLELWR